MAQNTTISVAPGAWTQLTDTNATSITFQNTGSSHIMVKGTTNATAPTDSVGALRYNPGQGERNVGLGDLFPGISAVRVWAFCDSGNAVMVSHA